MNQTEKFLFYKLYQTVQCQLTGGPGGPGGPFSPCRETEYLLKTKQNKNKKKNFYEVFDDLITLNLDTA